MSKILDRFRATRQSGLAGSTIIILQPGANREIRILDCSQAGCDRKRACDGARVEQLTSGLIGFWQGFSVKLVNRSRNGRILVVWPIEKRLNTIGTIVNMQLIFPHPNSHYNQSITELSDNKTRSEFHRRRPQQPPRNMILRIHNRITNTAITSIITPIGIALRNGVVAVCLSVLVVASGNTIISPETPFAQIQASRTECGSVGMSTKDSF